MRNELYRDARTVTCTLFVAAAGLLGAGPLSADPLNRLSADFQNNTSIGGSGEISTNLPPPGIVTYSKTVLGTSAGKKNFDTLYVTFSAQGDEHNGSALALTATVNGQFCEPLLGQTTRGGGGTHEFPRWYTLSHLPRATGVTNCNDGGGGTADCHDNTISFTCCAKVEKSAAFPHPVVQIRLADLPGFSAAVPGSANNIAFYDRATIYIDGEEDEGANHCTGHGFP
jgi:hypothetical protein